MDTHPDARRAAVLNVKAIKNIKPTDYAKLRELSNHARQQHNTGTQKLKALKQATKNHQDSARLQQHKMVYTLEAERLQRRCDKLEKTLFQMISGNAERENQAKFIRNGGANLKKVHTEESEMGWDEFSRMQAENSLYRRQEALEMMTSMGEVLTKASTLKQQRLPLDIIRIAAASQIKSAMDHVTSLEEQEAGLIAELDSVASLRPYMEAVSYSSSCKRLLFEQVSEEEDHIDDHRIDVDEIMGETYRDIKYFVDEEIQINFEAAINVMMHDQVAVLRNLRQEFAGAASPQLASEWTTAKHFYYTKIFDEYNTHSRAIPGQPIANMIRERINMETDNAANGIEEYYVWFQGVQSYNMKMDNIKRNFDLRRKEMIITMKEVLLETAQAGWNKMNKEIDSLEEGYEKEKKRDALADLRHEKWARMRLTQNEEREAFEAAQQEESRITERKELKSVLYKYEREKKVREDLEKEVDSVKRFLKERDAKENQVKNIARVEHREKMYQRTILDANKKREDAKRLQLENDYRTNRFKEKHRPQVEADTERLTSETVATKANREAVPDKSLFHETSGFRVMQALRNANLHETQYAKDILSSLNQTNKKIRRDNMTTEQLTQRVQLPGAFNSLIPRRVNPFGHCHVKRRCMTTINTDIWAGKLGLEARSPSVSKTIKFLDFNNNPSLRNNYINPFGGIRIGFVLEELDAMAGKVAYAHALGNSSFVSDVVLRPSGDEVVKRIETPMTIVTASCNRIMLWTDLPANLSLQFEGLVTWVGNSSMEVCVYILQYRDAEPVRVLESYFTMVARDKNNRAIKLPPLLLKTEQEKVLFARGEANSRERKLEAARSLEITPPNIEENAYIHGIHRDTQNKIREGRLGMEWSMMKSAKNSSLVLMQPQSRNIHNKIFGGYLMRKAFELAWSSTFIFTGVAPSFSGMDDTSFVAPVEIGDSVMFTSQISYIQDKRVIVSVIADVISPRRYSEKGEPFRIEKYRKTTNIFRFAFTCNKAENIRQIYPESYEEVMALVNGKRIYEDLYGKSSVEPQQLS
ncbi:acyl-coenzyme A thioesterase 9, mitochondrial-like [Planoprotostelium fungivorum]|uniref:Acyl-coenzyme A thioesterase 9, mitochondrial-like n=1 Tax=Planoprotostelium fungivorum TaxID=1890364 RepID=A0A2P6NN57_9EUKA|nr:acyl-coenzyme A thioesterase 9, mitochondrial-like [Planoprotostelium fungivorum]